MHRREAGQHPGDDQRSHLPANELHEYWRTLLAELEDTQVPTPAQAAAALRELADRQWHTYTLIAPEINQQIDIWVCEHWALAPRSYIINLLSIIGNLGLPKSYTFVKRVLAQDVEAATRELIESLVRQVGEHIDDPYFDLPQP